MPSAPWRYAPAEPHPALDRSARQHELFVVDLDREDFGNVMNALVDVGMAGALLHDIREVDACGILFANGSPELGFPVQPMTTEAEIAYWRR